MSLAKLREVWNALGARQRLQIGIAVLATLGLVWGFTLYANRIRYGVLFTNLEQGDAAAVMARLKEQHVPYRLAAGGSVVEVPTERVDELRLQLAGEGLPPGGGVGFEIFDKPAFGLSNFVQNVNYQRALERELARTIQSLESVTSARVHLAIPEESVFADEHREPSASVVVRMRPGKVMAKERVQAIVNLVASGVEGLSPEHVSVIDGEGRMLSGGEDDARRVTAAQDDAKHGQEEQIESTLVSLLEPIVGRGKVRARATVELNLTKVDRVQESYDPNVAVVRSEQKTKTEPSGGGPSGVPGTTSNMPGGEGVVGEVTSGQKSQTSLTNFELNKTVSTISEPVGTLARQSVAVVVDHATVEQTDAEGQVQRVSTPRTPEEMQKITDLVRAAIGFDETRRDTLTVENVPFEAVPTLEDSGAGFSSLLPSLLRYGSLPVAVLLLALFVIRPGIAALRNASRSESAPAGTRPPTVAELQAQLARRGGTEAELLGSGGSVLQRRLVDAIREDPQTAALVVRHWMNE